MGKPAEKRYPWRGFERPPEGCLFEQVVDAEGDMGVAYERCLRFEKGMHVHDRLLLVFPREGTSMRVRTVAQGSETVDSFAVTHEDGLAVPEGLLHDDHWITEVYDTFALLPSRALVRRASRKAGTTYALDLDRAVLFARGSWLTSLLREYFEERVLRGRKTGPRHGALEDLIAFEVCRSLGESIPEPKAESDPGPSTTVARALRHLEGNLFGDVDLEDLCRASGTSRSSLLRRFRSEVGATPKAYLLGRRLDEARRLLGQRRHDVGEVARLVGYSNAGAFSEAFRRRFGEAPSARPK
ncbi:MAG: AraC family transcriptional regulator [Polyangiaceae bacterium]